MAATPPRRPVVFTPAARAQLRAIPQTTALRILRALARFAASGEGDVRRLEAVDPPAFRLAGNEIQVLAVKHRRDAYR